MLKNASIYLFGGILNRAIPFLLLPIMTRFLSPQEYGTLAIFQVFLSFTTPFVGMNMSNNISRNFSKMDRVEMARLIGTVVGLLCISTGIVVLFAIGWVFFKGPTFGIPSEWLLLLPFVAATGMIHQFNLTVLRNQERAVAFGGYQVGSTVLNVLLSLLLVVVFGYGWQGRASGIVLSALCFGIIGFFALKYKHLLSFKYDGKQVREVLSISLPLIPHALGAVIITMSDRLFIDHMVTKEAVGLYAVGYTFGMIVNLFVESFNRAWSPWFYRKMNKAAESTKHRIIKYTYFYFAGILLLAALIAGVSFLFLPVMVGDKYQGAANFILWIAIAYAFRGMYTMVFPYLVHVGRTGFLGVWTLFSALSNVVLNYILIDLNGAIGAAQATVISFVMMFILTWIYAARICPMPWLLVSSRK